MKTSKSFRMKEAKQMAITEKQAKENEPLHTWIVLIGVTVGFGILNGTIRSYGLIYVEMLDLFNEGPVKTSLVLTIQSISHTVASVFFGFLSDQITARWVVMTAGVFSCLAFVTTSLAPSLTFVYLSYSLFLGICDAAIYIFCFRMLNQYFEERRSLANGIATAGSSLGALLLPFLFASLLDRYSVRGLFLVCGGLWLNISVSGALLRPVASERKRLQISKTSEGCENKAYEGDYVSAPGTQDMKEQEIANKAEYSREKVTVAVVKLETDNRGSSPNHAGNEINKVKETTRSGNTKDDNFKKQNVFEGLKLRKFKSNLLFFCSFEFFLLNILWFLGALGFFGTASYLPAYAVEKNLTLSQTSLFLSLIGGFDLLGRIAVGYVGDRDVIPKRLLVAVGLIITGTATILLPKFSSYTGFVIYCCIFGATAGVFIPLTGPLIVEVLGVERVGAGFGIFSLCFGISAAVQPLLFSTMKEMTGSYSPAFFLIGGVSIFNAFITILGQFLSTRNTKREDKIEVDDKRDPP